ncbi:HNH endonuclease [Streptomyces sp. NBC_01390]|uniref:HNH endonuclease n=1 Tax=Streptomyces sp. NBC_01390 TaxID=2903850 RepID=UPI00386D9975
MPTPCRWEVIPHAPEASPPLLCPRLPRTHHGCPLCAQCGSLVLADGVDVDHVRPLAMGGTDTDGNVQVLCRGCHQLKTATEFGRAV